uniref:Uncharacterized protein n=1 Tax=viral metagenome TaxID=1070528 RepID=A0A6C0L667_9ZZZZ
MTARLYASITIVLALYVGYCLYSQAEKDVVATSVESFVPVQVPVPAAADMALRIVEQQQMQVQQQVPVQRVMHVKDEAPFDPSEHVEESAQIPERLRHPERSFSPGYVNDETQNAVASGVASYSADVTARAEQTFGPEFVQNGGQFMEGIVANDDSAAVAYSGF